MLLLFSGNSNQTGICFNQFQLYQQLPNETTSQIKQLDVHTISNKQSFYAILETSYLLVYVLSCAGIKASIVGV